MLDIYPLVPLFANQALGIALFSYDGGLFWGFNSDWDALPDLHDLVRLWRAKSPIRVLALTTNGLLLLDQAEALQRTGRKEEAEAIYSALLSSEPRNAGALHGLGHWGAHAQARAEALIDIYLAENRAARPELVNYARAARAGCIQ